VAAAAVEAGLLKCLTIVDDASIRMLRAVHNAAPLDSAVAKSRLTGDEPQRVPHDRIAISVHG